MGLKQPGREAHHPPPSSAEFKNAVAVPLLFPYVFMVCTGVTLKLTEMFPN